MFKHTTYKLALVFLAFTATACSTMSTDYRMTYDQTGSDLSNLKQGTACITQEFLQGQVGDATIGAAAKAGGISKVKYIEHLGHDDSRCVVVYGN